MNQILNDLYGDDNNKKNQSQFNNVKINEKEKKTAKKLSENKIAKENKKREWNKSSYGKADIVKVGKIFSILLIIFGIIIISKSVYSLTVNADKKHDDVQVTTEKMGREVTITISSNYPIKEFFYKWNTGEPTTITGDGTVNMKKTIDIPNGNNILNIEIIDCYGNSTKYMKQYIYESKDSGKPTIDISKSGSKLKIIATDDTKISYLTYAWNDDETTRVDVSNDEKSITTEVDVPKGENKLTITAVDAEENREIREETIVGATKPTFTISTDGTNVVISAQDESGIDKINITIDGDEMSSGDKSLNQKQVVAKIPTTSGTHNISVTVVNVNGLEETKTISVSI